MMNQETNSERSTTSQNVPVPVRVQDLSALATEHVPVPDSKPIQPVVVNVVVPEVSPMAAVSNVQPPKQNVFKQYWQKAGGGSFTVSLLIHIAILFAAYFVVETVVVEKKVDFLPGGGSKAGADASASVSNQVQVKKRSVMNQRPQMQRLVSQSQNAAIALPDVPMDAVDVPQMSSMMGGGAMGSGGFGSGGFGGGSGNGFGTGNMGGFLASTVFGRLGGTDGIPGKLYDFKQSRDGKALEYDPNKYFEIVRDFTGGRFSDSKVNKYYQAPQEMSFTFLAVSAMDAAEGPKAFQVDKYVQPRGWMVHYSGVVTPPAPGEYRFSGYFDDALAVFIDGKPVLDASRGDEVVAVEVRERERAEVKSRLSNVAVVNGFAYAGKWVKISGPVKIDIIVGERPGGVVGGLLMVEERKGNYKKRADGSPILPLFATSKPDMEDMKRIQEFGRTASNSQFGIDTEQVIIFKPQDKPSLDGSRMGTRLIGR